jgi:cytochrome c biogenesis protein CcmG, thiol:disulfide interchange protein DsbE
MTNANKLILCVVRGLAVAIVGLLLIPLAAHAAQVGDPAPAFRLPTQTGEIALADAKGRVVYVDFWASWCGPCKLSFPWMNTVANRYRDKGFEVVAINVDTSKAAAERFLKTTPAAFTIAFDPAGTTAKQFAVKGMPMSYLIDVDGRILLTHSGFKSEDAAALESAIEQALKKVKK